MTREVTAEVVIDNKDIGFVQRGAGSGGEAGDVSVHPLRHRAGNGAWVTADAVQDEKRGAIFPATLRLARSQIDVDGRSIRLSPGMNLMAEVKTGRRRLIEYLLSPIKEHAGTSLKER